MQSDIQPDIEREVERIVGGKAVRVADVDAPAEDNRACDLVKLETAHATYTLPAKPLLRLLQNLPDEIGVNALRQRIEQQF